MSVKTNGRPRKQLADQLDRLDGIIDSLSDGLNQAVAGAVEAAVGQAVKQAVEGVLTELVSNPTVRELLARTATAAAAGPTPAESPQENGTRRRPSMLETAGQRLRAVGRACVAGVQRTWQVVLAAGAGVAATAAWVDRSRLAVAATAVCGWAAGLAAGTFGRLLPALGLAGV
jgi:hypothetical protein